MQASPTLFLGNLSLARSAATVANTYGIKTAGIEDPLLSLQGSSPVPYSIPDRIALPPRVMGEVTTSDLRRAFEEIARLSDGPRPWLARSSALNEQSGLHDSPVFYVDPQDRQGSFQRFESTVRTMMAGDPELGVLLMPMVGEWSVLSGGGRVFGAEIVSFAADTVNPFRPSEMHFAFTQGLGIGAVGTGNDAVLVTVDRDTGKITFFGNLDENSIRRRCGSDSPPFFPDTYRQKRQYFFDPRTMGIESLDLAAKYSLPYTVSMINFDGVLSRAIGGTTWDTTGMTPFDDPEMFSNLISIMQFLHAEKGRSQIEGAFLNRTAPFPYLYQHIAPPQTPQLERDIAPLKRHIYTDRVIGSASFEGPLVWYLEEGEYGLSCYGEVLKEIDEAFADSGYIVLGVQGREMINRTPHCRHRIVEYRLNSSGHLITLMRYLMNEHPEAGFTVSENARVMNMNQGCLTIAGIRGTNKYYGKFAVFNKARLDSNGRELVVEIVGKPTLLDRLFAF